jgi:hypothetical protein
MMGGRRSRRKTRKVGRSRKLRGGMGYGFGGNTIGTAGAQWDSSWGGEVTKAGVPVYDTADPQRGSSRRKRVKKTKSKTKKASRKMKGGAPYQSVGTVGAAFTGQGSRGLADYTGYASKVPPAGGPAQGVDGVYKP